MNALDYLLKANLYGLLFVGCYHLLLRRHTFFTLNRTYLLVSAALSLLLPLMHLPTQTAEILPVPVGVIGLPVSVVAVTPVEAPEAFIDWEQAGSIVYGLIALGLVVQLVYRLVQLRKLIRQSPRQVCNDYVLVQPGDPSVPTFSFFRQLVINPADRHSELIIQHELVHIRQHHSVDVLGMTLLKAVFWACPVLWLFDRALRQVHEFLADRTNARPTDYAHFLVEYSFGVRPDALTNGFFNPSLLKQRIVMLHQKATNHWALGKYALVIPLAFGLLAMTTAKDEITAVVRQVTDDTITVSGRVTSQAGKPLPSANVVIVGTNKGISTDAGGRFKLTAVPKTASIAVSFVGFKTNFIPVESRAIINVVLSETSGEELPTMGATAAYKGIKPNPAMPVRTPPSSETINGEVYRAVEEPPVFPTGIPGLMQYISHNLRYPAKAKANRIQGEVLVSFVVLPTGSIGSAKVVKGIGSGCDEEAVRVVKQMPKWIPGQQNGKPTGARYTLPIQFALEKTAYQTSPTAQPDSGKKQGFNLPIVFDKSKNSRFALYNDVKSGSVTMQRYSMRLPDTLRFPDSLRRGSTAGSVKGFGPSPLYLVDGVETTDLKNLYPDKIQSIEVFKGASAAIYGEKGKNGVVIITTKKS